MNAIDSERKVASDSSSQGDNGGMSRRLFVKKSLQVAGLSGAVLLPAWEVAVAEDMMRRLAQGQKSSQASVQYQDSPKGDQKCDGCTFFQAPATCQVVDGQISPSGWCNRFAAKRGG